MHKRLSAALLSGPLLLGLLIPTAASAAPAQPSDTTTEVRPTDHRDRDSRYDRRYDRRRYNRYYHDGDCWYHDGDRWRRCRNYNRYRYRDCYWRYGERWCRSDSYYSGYDAHRKHTRN